MIAKELIDASVIAIGHDEPVSKLIGKLDKHDARDAYIVSDGKLQGIFDTYSLMRSRIDVSEAKVSGFLRPSAKIDEDENHDEVFRKMVASAAGVLPVYSKQGLRGMVTRYSLLAALKELDLDLKVKDIDAKEHFVGADDGIGKAIHKMHKEKLLELPVKDSKGEVIGMLRSHELLANFYLQHISRDRGLKPRTKTKAFSGELDDMLALPVRNFMGDVLRVSSQDPLHKAASAMADAKALGMVDEKGRFIDARSILLRLSSSKQDYAPKIRYVGLDKTRLQADEVDRLEAVSKECAEKLTHRTKKRFEIVLHIKEHRRKGSRHRYEVNTRLTYPGHTISSSDDGWDVLAAARKTFEAIDSQMESRGDK